MKKLTYLFLTLLIVACSSDDNSSNSIDYFFEFEFGGVINRVEGNSSSTTIIGFPWQVINVCYGTTDGVILSITDITAESYVSGQNMQLAMSLDNAQLGSNTGSLIIFDGFYIEEYLESIGANSTGFVENIGDSHSQRGIMTDINITDLGISSSTSNNGGENIKGSYEKVVYFRSIVNGDYDIPVPIRIEFSAVRI